MDGEIDLNPFRRRLKKRGQPADALVRSSEEARWQDSEGSFRTYDYVVEVRPAGGEPFEATIRDAHSAFMRPKPGDLVPVKFDPKSRKVAFDLDGDPRYDLAAQGDQTWTSDQPRRTFPATPPPFATAPGPPVPDPDDVLLGRLERLGALRDSGVLTAEEFAAQKARLLAGA